VLVRVDQEGTPRTEFRTTRRYNASGRLVVEPLSHRVLDDAVLLVGVSGDAELIDRCADAVASPHWPLYLGRREHPPTGRVLLGVTSTDVESAVAGHPWLAADWYQRAHPEGESRLESYEALPDRGRTERRQRLYDETPPPHDPFAAFQT
jgi:CRISPR system Cascade subunit CasD